MKKIVSLLIGLLVASVVGAQIIQNGYYRVKNTDTERYATVIDDYGRVDYQSTSADVGAIRTYKKNEDAEWNATKVISNPGSIIYAEGNSNNEYRLKCQGADTYSMVGTYLIVKKLSTGHYSLYASKEGMTKYLFDLTRAGRDSSECVVNASNYKGGSLNWDVYPVNAEGDDYFGMYPTLQNGSDYYLPFYAGFPFTFHSQGMKAYYISLVDKDLNVAVWKEISGEIPAGMPIIARCSSQEPTNNRLDIHNSSATAPADNLLKGVYFCRIERQGDTNPHHDCLANDKQTMRVLGMLSDGSLGMKVYAGDYIPKNSSYLQVEAGTAEELKLVTEEEYQEMKANIKVESVSLDQHEVSLALNKTIQLNATVLPEDAKNKALTWTSSNPEVATVSESGVVTAISKGTAIITAEAQDGSGMKDQCSVTTYSELAESITLNQTSATVKMGETLQLSATVQPETTVNKEVAWTSSDANIATVDAAGLVTAINQGTAIVTATTTDGTSLTASCSITVNPILAESITLNQTSATVKMGEIVQLSATVLPENTVNKEVAWASSDVNIATVDAKGLVTAISQGAAAITATTTDGTSLTATCNIYVNPILAESISLSETQIEVLDTVKFVQLSATIMPENATAQTAEWRSSNNTVAEVDGNGLVTINSAGEAIITAKTTDGSNLEASCTITVIKYEPPTPPSPTLLGDANEDGVVDVSDITTIAAYILGTLQGDFNAANADANSDGVVDVADITTTASIILGTDVKRGDANGDGVVDVADITTIAAYILGQNPESFNSKNADANADGVVDVADITATAGIILNVKAVKQVVRECIENVKKAKKGIVIPAEYEAIW